MVPFSDQYPRDNAIVISPQESRTIMDPRVRLLLCLLQSQPHRRRLGPPRPYKREWTHLGLPLVLVVVLNVAEHLPQTSMVFLLPIIRRHLCPRSNNLSHIYGPNTCPVIIPLPILTLELPILRLIQDSSNSRNLQRHRRSWVPVSLNGIRQFMALGILKLMK